MSRTAVTQINNVRADTKLRVLERLRLRRARSRRDKVTVGAHLLRLKEQGDITQAEFDYVMGIGDAPKKKEPKIAARQ